MEILAKNFTTRNDIESFILAEIGSNTKLNKEAGHLIVGTRLELKVLLLSDTSTIYGCSCLITDSPTKDLLADKLKEKKDK